MNRRKWIYIGILIVVAAIVSIASFSYAFLTRVDEQHGKINIVAGTLDYKIESDNLSNNSITLSANESKEIEITIKSLNTIDSKYQLYTNNVENVDIRYTDEEEPGVGTITSNGTKTIKIVLENNSDTDKTITFGVQGGFEDKTLTLEDNRVAVVLGERLCKIGDVYNFDYTGDVQEFTAKCSGTYKIEAWGAQGKDMSTFTGGKGGYTSGNIKLEKNKKLYVYVGDNNGYNGGAVSSTAQIQARYGNSGGSATDIRYFGDNYTPTSQELEWNSSLGLNSRIMVAGGGGGGNNRNIDSSSFANGNGGAGGGLIGNSGTVINHGGWGYGLPSGGTQTSGGTITSTGNVSVSINCNGFFGISANENCSNIQSGGGSGYYSGAIGIHAGGAGGSSFISGYIGSLTIEQGSTSEPRAIKDGCTSSSRTLECSTHYSGMYFTNAVMIDGAGCDWSTGSAANCGVNQPQPDGTNAVGHSGNGYARITYLGTRTVTFNANGGEISETSRKVNYGYEVGELPTPTKKDKVFLGWYTDANYTTKVDSAYKVEDNTTLYAAWGTEINLNLAGRTQGYPSNTAYDITTKRSYTMNTYIVGLAFDNYYSPTAVASSSITNNTITMNSSSGYGIGLPVQLSNGSYVLSANVTLPSAQHAILSVVKYTSDGSSTYNNTGKQGSGKITLTFTIDSTTSYQALVFTNNGSSIDTIYQNINLYKLD